MDCVKCTARTRVVRTLQCPEGTDRIRACDGCGHVFRTSERHAPREDELRTKPQSAGGRRG